MEWLRVCFIILAKKKKRRIGVSLQTLDELKKTTTEDFHEIILTFHEHLRPPRLKLFYIIFPLPIRPSLANLMVLPYLIIV